MTTPPPSNLLGPPELRYPHLLSSHTTTSSSSSATASSSVYDNNDLFMTLMAFFNPTRIDDYNLPPMGFTENYSPTFLSTGNPCLDFFFHVVPNTPSETLTYLLQAAWSHNALTTLKLICNLRGVRGKGKTDKKGFYTAALWLHRNHPKTLACNVDSIADFGYFKDLPEILYRLLEGSDIRKKQRKESSQKTMMKKRRVHSRYLHRKTSTSPITAKRKTSAMIKLEEDEYEYVEEPRVPVTLMEFLPAKWNKKIMVLKEEEEKARVRKEEEEKARVQKEEEEKATLQKEEASVLRHEKYVTMAKKAFERYTRDPNYRFLFERVSDLFADRLKSDLQSLNSGKLNNISLAAKWCPSIDSSFDRATLLCETIARKVFPLELYPEYEGVKEAYYTYRVRDRLRKQVLVPLRKALELPEVYIGANRWDLLRYERVASVAMKFYKEKFMKHDKDRFEAYLEKVKSGKAKIAAGALLPHEIVQSLNDGEGDGGEVAELQWRRMVDDLSKIGKLNNCLAICDVSGSMHGIPKEVSVALGILVSELSEEPWKGKLITFSSNPQLQKVEGDSLRSKSEFVKKMEWGMNTDFQKVFDLILNVAVNGKLSPDDMIKRVFVFSDMEFDEASENDWETDYQVITKKFNEHGYGSAVPEIVFWNLRDSKATPVPSNQKGVALVSGFSKNLLTLFLEGGCDSLSPEAVMDAAISGEEYSKLVVLD